LVVPTVVSAGNQS